jgi:dipeptidyl aminopeptidase/acylaminoacyl peptidase
MSKPGVRLLTVALCATVAVTAAAAQKDGQILERSLEKGTSIERVTYASDGLAVVALVYRPAAPSGKLPAVIYNRGGYTAVDTPEQLQPLFETLGKAGFAVIAPMLRESYGAPGKDEVGGADLRDLMNVLPLAKNLGFVDPDALFLLGESRGGMMTYQAIRDGFPARAAVTWGAFTDFNALIEAHPDVYQPLVRKIFENYEQRAAEIHERRSALVWADKLNVPVMILQGGADRGVDATHALRLTSRLQELKKPFELHILKDGNHTLSNVREERDRLIVDWLRRNLK